MNNISLHWGTIVSIEIEHEYKLSLSKLMSISDNYVLALIRREIFSETISSHKLKELSKPYWKRIIRLQGIDGSWFGNRGRYPFNRSSSVTKRRKLKLTLKNLENLYWCGFTKEDHAISLAFSFLEKNIDSQGIFSEPSQNYIERLYLTSWFYKLSMLFSLSKRRISNVIKVVEHELNNLVTPIKRNRDSLSNKSLEQFISLLTSYLNILIYMRKITLLDKVISRLFYILSHTDVEIFYNYYHNHPTRIVRYLHLLEAMQAMKSTTMQKLILSKILYVLLNLRYEDKLWYLGKRKKLDYETFLLNFRILRVINSILKDNRIYTFSKNHISDFLSDITK